MTVPDDADMETICRYRDLYDRQKLWQKMTWRGFDVAKTPEDMWLYQEAIQELKPTLIVEFGTSVGGTALFFADMLDVCVGGDSVIVSIDTVHRENRPRHGRLRYHTGHSRHDGAIQLVRGLANERSGPVLIIEDSEHIAKHIAAELEVYHSLVSVGSWFVLEDCCWPDQDQTMQETIDAFLSEHPEFVRDDSKWKYNLTVAPNGWLKRIR